MRSAARLTYEQAQAAADGKSDAITGPLLKNVIQPLYAAYEILARARKARGTLDLDVAEREIKIDPHGRVARIGTRARLESHKLVEEFMILANVAAATALQERGMAGLYRIHDSPSAEKLENLRGFLKGFDIKLPQGQQLRPADLARVLEKFIGTDHAPVINEVMLRSQAQAVYSPENIGHFGLALARYAHFTSPIRRYADLIVHRALIRLFKLGEDGLTDDEMKGLEKIGEHISQTERRAIEAERSASDRYASLYLAENIGEEFDGRISGVTHAGIFVRLNDTGADGFVPMRELPQDYYHFEEARHMLIGRRHGLRLSLANKVRVKLVEADPVVGGLRFALLTGNNKQPVDKTGKTGRPFHRNRKRPRRRH
jgi:ribonuclease R